MITQPSGGNPAISGAICPCLLRFAIIPASSTIALPGLAMNTSTACLTLIAALARRGVIGLNNTLPWRLPEDLKRFKALTLGHPVIMGRKTWQSLGRPLPGRDNIVISRQPGFQAEGARQASDIAGALHLARATGTDEIFVIGGGEIYRQCLPLAQRLQLTEIDHDFEGDAFFPDVDRSLWQETARQHQHAEAGFDYDFVTYQRI